MDEPINNFINKVLCGDALEILKKIPEESIDMIFVDPPYNLQLPNRKLIRWNGTVVNGVKDKWDKFNGFEDYDKFTTNWLEKVKKVMKPKATIWVIGTYHNIFRVGKIMHDLGFWILNNVVWLKTNPVPNFKRVRFTNATETLIWAVKNKNIKGHTFNYEFAKKFGGGKVGANVWEIPVCNGIERIKNDRGEKIHSTQKPERLLECVVLTSTNPEDIILDPFAGTGTTPYIAKKYGRKFIAIEKEEKYIHYMKRRLDFP